VTDRIDEDGRLRLLVGLNRLWLAGAELNAVDLAMQFRADGHHVVLVGKEEDDRVMIDLAERRGIPLHVLPNARPHKLIGPLESVVRQERIQLIHMYYSRLLIAALLGPHRRWGIPVVSTDYNMVQPHNLPPHAHLIVGTQECADNTRPWFDGPISVIEPPVDVNHDHPDAIDVSGFLAACEIHDLDRPRVVMVSRLDREMKLEGVLRVVDACAAMEPPGVNVIIVGSGDGVAEVRRAADRVNESTGRRAVVLTGRLSDPRAAYAAADVVVGMGSSALRAMAFEKPVVVVGEKGFALPFEPSTAEYFFWRGFYGEGPMYDLGAALERLLRDPALRASLGRFGRRTVEARYSLELAHRHLEKIYLAALQDRSSMSERWLNAMRAGKSYAETSLPKLVHRA
jgi:glycosyltransferase involved in cell wall biosynthesis